MDDRLRGIGGWLAFFIVTLCFGAIASAIDAFRFVHAFRSMVQPGTMADWGAYLAIVGVLGVVRLAAYGFMAWRLIARRVPTTPPLILKLLWIVAIVPPVIDNLSDAVLLDAGSAAIWALGTKLVRPLVYCALWSAYLLRSERVANTYAADEHVLAAVFE